MKSFDIFNYWAQRNKISELSAYMIKNTKKTIGDFVYKAGERVNSIFFLHTGEVEISLQEKSKSKFSIKDDELIIRETPRDKFHRKIFRRLIKAPNPIGIEELLSENKYRVFSAVIRSTHCTYFEMPKEKIFLDLMSKNPMFLSLLMKYSC